MAMPSKELRDFQLAIHFETNRAVDLRRLAAFLAALADFAEERLGSEAEFELNRLSTGSVTAVFDSWGSVIGGLGGFGSFVIATAIYIENNRQRRLSRRAAELVLDDHVVTISVQAKNVEQIVIHRSSMAAVEALIEQRENQTTTSDWQTGLHENIGGTRFRPRATEDARPASPVFVSKDGEWITNEYGDEFVTENGNRLAAAKGRIMPTTNLSITPPTFVQFDWNGWPDVAKGELIKLIRTITGVTAVNQAGANSSIHVHFEPSLTNRDDLVLAVNKAADEVLPGHNFSNR